MKVVDVGSNFPSCEVGAFRGAIRGLSNKKYHGLTTRYFSSTHLKYMYSTSAAHFHHKYYSGKYKDVAGPSLLLGSVVHCLLLEPNVFDVEFYTTPKFDLRKNVDKELKAELEALNVGKIGIDEEILARANLMAASVRANSEAAELLGLGDRELSYFWECQFSKLRMRAKVDAGSFDHLVELKTAASAEPKAFARQVYNLNYDLSLRHYSEAIRSVTGVEPAKKSFIVVESEAPYVCQVYRVGPGFLETGHTKWLDAVTRLSRSLDVGKWPGYVDSADGEQFIDAPSWALPKVGNVVEENNVGGDW